MASILTNADKDTAETSDALTGDVTLNIGGVFSDGAKVRVTLSPASGTGYSFNSKGGYYAITALTGTTLKLKVLGGNTTDTAIDADLL